MTGAIKGARQTCLKAAPAAPRVCLALLLANSAWAQRESDAQNPRQSTLEALAIVSARLDYYGDNITEMRRFLYLEPNGHPAATDARSAQDQIYQWEGLLAAQ
jgi:hypothetical protein